MKETPVKLDDFANEGWDNMGEYSSDEEEEEAKMRLGSVAVDRP